MLSEKQIKGYERAFSGIFIMAILGSVIMSLGLVGVIIWAIIQLVVKF